jgi:hypothetical protein
MESQLGYTSASLVVLCDDSLLHALILNSNSYDEASEHRTELDPPVTESNLPASQLAETR